MKKHFSRRFKVKALALGLSIIVVVVLIAIATGATGAYFSDTNNGGVAGTIGSIQVSTTGGTGTDGMTFTWPYMLPGVHYTATVNFQNTGNNPQDVYLNFNNLTALSALNTLGTYGSVHVYVNGNPVYSNINLNDIPNNGTSGVPHQILLAQNVGPTASGTMVFDFEYASKMTTQEPGGVFNLYPITTGGTDARYVSPGNGHQSYVNATDGTGNGLPFQIVATQVGIAPGDAGGPAN